MCLFSCFKSDSNDLQLMAQGESDQIQKSHSAEKMGNESSKSSSSSGKIISEEGCHYLKQNNMVNDPVLSLFQNGIKYIKTREKNNHQEIAVIVDALKGVILGFNHKLTQKFGYSANDLLGKSINTLMGLEQEKTHGDWAHVVHAYFEMIVKKHVMFPYHVAKIPHQTKNYFIHCHVVVEHLEAKFKTKAIHPAKSSSSTHEEANDKSAPAVHGAENVADKIESIAQKVPFFIVIFSTLSTDHFEKSVEMQKQSVLQIHQKKMEISE